MQYIGPVVVFVCAMFVDNTYVSVLLGFAAVAWYSAIERGKIG